MKFVSLLATLGTLFSCAKASISIDYTAGQGWILTSAASLPNLEPGILVMLYRPGYLKLADLFMPGDIYNIYVDSVLQMSSSTPYPPGAAFSQAVDANFAYTTPGVWSTAYLPLGPGPHNITFTVSNPETFNPGCAGVRVDYQYYEDL